MKKLQKKRYAIVVTWQPSAVACEYGFIQAWAELPEDVTELDHIGGRILPVAQGARIGQRVSLFPADKAAA